MTIRTILTEPNEILRQKSQLVEEINKEIKELMDDMLETMCAAPGIGLAAIQIGIPKRVIVIDIDRDKEIKNPMYFVNPEIIWRAEENSIYEEGCLSVPNQFAEINRPKNCHVKYLNYNGEPQLLKAEGLLATCIQTQSYRRN
jgi:peptide deformylase